MRANCGKKAGISSFFRSAETYRFATEATPSRCICYPRRKGRAGWLRNDQKPVRVVTRLDGHRWATEAGGRMQSWEYWLCDCGLPMPVELMNEWGYCPVCHGVGGYTAFVRIPEGLLFVSAWEPVTPSDELAKHAKTPMKSVFSVESRHKSAPKRGHSCRKCL